MDRIEAYKRISELIGFRDNLKDADRGLAGLATYYGFKMNQQNKIRDVLKIADWTIAGIKSLHNPIGTAMACLDSLITKFQSSNSTSPQMKKILENAGNLLFLGNCISNIVTGNIIESTVQAGIKFSEIISLEKEKELEQLMDKWWKESQEFSSRYRVVLSEIEREIAKLK